MYIEKKVLAILALSISAIVLILANMSGRVAKADVVISDRDYQLITASSPSGGDDLYVYDGASGILAVYKYDPNTQGLALGSFQTVSQIFGR